MARPTNQVVAVLETIFSSLDPEDSVWFLRKLQEALDNSLPGCLASHRAFSKPAKHSLEKTMSLDKMMTDLLAALAANTAAVEANTLALKGASTGAAVTTSVAEPKPKADAKPKKDEKVKEEAFKAKHTREELAGAMGLLKEKKGTPAAKAMIKEVGLSDTLAGVAEENIDALYDAATAATAEEDL